jgi:hypothetical protein
MNCFSVSNVRTIDLSCVHHHHRPQRSNQPYSEYKTEAFNLGISFDQNSELDNQPRGIDLEPLSIANLILATECVVYSVYSGSGLKHKQAIYNML